MVYSCHASFVPFLNIANDRFPCVFDLLTACFKLSLSHASIRFRITQVFERRIFCLSPALSFIYFIYLFIIMKDLQFFAFCH